MKFRIIVLHLVWMLHFLSVQAQEQDKVALLDLDRIYSGEFNKKSERTIQWVEDGEAYVTIERSGLGQADELIRYDSKTQLKSVFVSADSLKTSDGNLPIESFSLSKDGSKVLIFTNSSRVWRSNTKGDYWVYDLHSGNLKQIGTAFEPSSVMFAKFSTDNREVFFVHQFNIYRENFETSQTDQLTSDGGEGIINGTFDWVYEEEFGKRDGFALSQDDRHLAFWHMDASDTGTFYMINNTDSIYSRPIPLQYPKVGQSPSATKIGVIDLKNDDIYWVPVQGGERENYIPGIQWINEDQLLIQQLNRHQNKLTVWSFKPSDRSLRRIYTETESTFVEIQYPDISADGWGSNDLTITKEGKSFLRMTENDAWRHIYKVDLANGDQTLVTPFDYDVASMRVATKKDIYYLASPSNSTQRYLFETDLQGKGKQKRLTPENFSGVNNYNISPNGKYAIHSHQNVNKVRTVRFVSLPDHKTIKTLVDNSAYANKLSSLDLPEVKFSKVTTEEGIEIDVRMVLPTGFDSSKKYPVLFHVYGEPWAQVATDTKIGLWNIMMAQKGYVVIDMDNRGTPCLKGSAWRKSIYRKVGRINVDDQAKAAKEILKLDYLDEERTSVWGWSGGGTMTLNLMFRYPETYKTGVAVAAVSNQLVYDNIYQERYMGLPQENLEDFIEGSPITYAKNLRGNLLVIHGTGDDNVHYQSAELLINELIRHNKKFQMMSYPNRSHGINEGENTTKHLYTLITDYVMEHNPVDVD